MVDLFTVATLAVFIHTGQAPGDRPYTYVGIVCTGFVKVVVKYT